MKCLNVKIKGNPELGLLHHIKDFQRNAIQIDNFNLLMKVT